MTIEVESNAGRLEGTTAGTVVTDISPNLSTKNVPLDAGNSQAAFPEEMVEVHDLFY